MNRNIDFLIILVVVSGMVWSMPARADITSGLIGYYPLDGDATDASGNGFDGTVNGDVEPVPDRMGYPDSAMLFPPDAGSHIDLGDRPEFQITAEMTLAAWVFLNSDNENNCRIIAKGGGSGQRSWNLNIEAESGGVANPATLQVSDTGAASTSLRDSESLPTDEWAHIAGVYRPGEAMELYVNGELKATNTSGVPNAQHSDNGLTVLIGSRNGCGNCGWDGLIDEARIYDRALSSDDIRELYEFVPNPRFAAWGPDPADGTNNVQIGLLQWKPGVTAVLHDVYFGTDPNLGPENLVQARNPLLLYYHQPGITPGTTYYWRVDEIEGDMATVHLGDVWSFLAQPYTAYLPTPAEGANEVSPDPNLTLTWLAGIGAAEHHVYFADNFADVNEATAAADKGTVTETSFMVPGPFDPLATYYWRVDEIAGDETVRTGAVWSFTTFQTVDNFESYTNEVGRRVFEQWVDGIGFTQPEPGHPGNGSGAAVGHDIWSEGSPHFDGTIMETKIVHGGSQSVPLYFDNTTPPYYSQADRTWASPQDWTAQGGDELVFYVHGKSGNAADPIYAKIEDSLGRSYAVDPNADMVTTSKWSAVKIPLSELTAAGVTATAVRKMSIGVGDRASVTPGGTGLLYIDDVRIVISGKKDDAGQ